MKILLAEDDKNIRLLTEISLERIGGHKVKTAEDGEIALKLALSEEFDLLLLDEKMPKMDGISVSQKYKKHPLKKKSPIIFFSAQVKKQNIEKFYENGIGFISKPFDPSNLSKNIENILKIKTTNKKESS